MAESLEPVQQNVTPLRRIADFTLIREIGRGGMGIVHEAIQDTMEHRPVALKELVLAGVVDPQREIRRFRKEITAMSQLDHANIVPIITIGNDGYTYFFTMKLIRGANLREIIASTKSLVNAAAPRRSGDTPPLADATVIAELEQSNAPPTASMTVHRDSTHDSYVSNEFVELMSSRRSLPGVRNVLQQVTRIGIQAAEALHHAHQLGIVHRDVKPANLLLDEENRVWVTDFGLARVAGDDGHTLPGQLVGTLRYMSPEQALSGRVVVDQRTDIFSLGVTLYEFLTLRRAFEGNSQSDIIHNVCFHDPLPLRRVNPAIPEDLETIISKAISKAPEDRYQTARELAEDLRRFENDEAIVARRPTVMQRCRRWLRRHRSLATAAAVMVALMSVVSMVSVLVVSNSLVAVTREKDRVEALLEQSEGLRLVANSTLQLSGNPGLALALAVHGAELHPCLEASNALMAAMGAIHELKTIVPRSDLRTAGVAVHPDGRSCVTTVSPSYFGKGSFPALVSDLSTGEKLLTLDDGTAITSAAYSPDGRTILCASIPGTQPARTLSGPEDQPGSVSLWDALTGRRIPGLERAVVTGPVSSQAFSGDSRLVVLPGDDGTARIYSTADGTLSFSLAGASGRVLQTAFSRNSDRILTIADDQMLQIWDARDRTLRPGQPLVSTPPAVVTAEFSGDGDVLIISEDSGIRVVSTETGQQLNPEHWSDSRAVVSRDGRQIASFHRFGRHVNVRDAKTFAMVSICEVLDPINNVAVSPDGHRISVATQRQAYVFAAETGELLATLSGHTRSVRSAAFLPDGQQLVTASDDSTIRVWSVYSGDERRTLMQLAETKVPPFFAVSEDGETILVSSDFRYVNEQWSSDGDLIPGNVPGRVTETAVSDLQLITNTADRATLWDLRTSESLREIGFASGVVREAHRVPGTATVVILIEGGSVFLWDTETNQTQPVLDTYRVALDCDIDPHSGRAGLAFASGQCVVLDPATGSEERVLRHDGRVVTVDFSNDGRKILTIDDRHVGRIWDDSSDTVPALTLQSPQHLFDAGVFTADDSQVLAWNTTAKALVSCWDSHTGELQHATATPVTHARVVVHPGRSLAAITSRYDGATLWDPETREEHRLTAAGTVSAAFLGDRLMSVGVSRQPLFGGFPWLGEFNDSVPQLKVWDINQRKELTTKPLQGEPLKVVADQKSGRAVVSLKQHEGELVRFRDGLRLAAAGRHSAPVVFQGFAAGGTRIVTASWDGTTSISALDGRRLHLLEGHRHPVNSGAISRDGESFVSLDLSGLGILWAIETGTETARLDGHTSPVHVVQYSRTGQHILTASGDGTVRLWDVPSGEPLKKFDIRPGILAATLSPDDKTLLVVPGQIVTESFPHEGPARSSDQHLLKTDQDPDAVLIDVASSVESLVTQSGRTISGRFRPDGTQLALVSLEGTVSVLDLPDLTPVLSIGSNDDPAANVTYSPDGTLLAVLHARRISLWDLARRTEICRMPGPDDPHTGVSEQLTSYQWSPFSRDGNWVLTSFQSRLMKWPVVPLSEARLVAPRPLSPQEIAQFLIELRHSRAP